MGEAKSKMMGAAAAAAMMGEATRPGKFIRAQRCENCKNAVEGAPGLPPGMIQCHGAPASAQAIFAPDDEGNMRQIGLVTLWPALRKDDPLSFCEAWKPRLLS